MENQIKYLEKSKVEIHINLNKDDLLPFKNKSLELLGGNLTLKGYRQGKAPLELVEKSVSAMELWEKTAIFALENFYPQIVKNNNIEAIGQPSVSIIKLVPDSLVEFKIESFVMPRLDLPDYKKITRDKQKDKKIVSIGEKEIDEALVWLQKTRQTINPETKEKEIPALDDKLAQSLGQFKTLDELKKNIKEGLILEKQDKERERWYLGIMEEISAEMKGEIPDILIQAEKEKMFEELKIKIAEIQLPFEEYLKQIKKTEEEIKKEFQPLAEKRVKMALIIRQIADLEKIEISKEETEMKINEILNHLPDPKMRDKINLEELKTFAAGLVRNDKVFQLLSKQQPD